MVAYSQGSKMLLSALSNYPEKMMAVSVAAMLAPCVNDQDLDAFVSQKNAKDVIRTLWEEKTYVIGGGVAWELTKERLCEKMSKGSCNLLELLELLDGMQPQSLANLDLVL